MTWGCGARARRRRRQSYPEALHFEFSWPRCSALLAQPPFDGHLGRAHTFCGHVNGLGHGTNMFGFFRPGKGCSAIKRSLRRTVQLRGKKNASIYATTCRSDPNCGMLSFSPDSKRSSPGAFARSFHLGAGLVRPKAHCSGNRSRTRCKSPK